MAATFLKAVDPISEVVPYLKNYPRVVMGVVLPLNGVVLGAIKPFLLPVVGVVGSVVFPILAGIKSCRGDHEEAKKYFRAWQISVVTVAACFAFIMVTGFVAPPKVGIGLMASVIACSIAFHVFRTVSLLHDTTYNK